MNRPLTLARLAGASYLAVAVLGGWAQLGARAGILHPGDAAATADAVVAQQDLMRLSVVADLLAQIAFVVLGVLLYRLFRETERTAAIMTVVLVAVSAGITVLNLVFQVASLGVALDPGSAAAFGAAGTDQLVLMLLELHSTGYTLAGIFFGLWLVPLALVALRGVLFPRWLGVVVLAAAVFWIVDTIAHVGLVGAPEPLLAVISTVPAIGELTLLSYLLIRGMRRVAPIAVSAPVSVS